MAQSFEAQVTAFVAKTKQRVEAVFKASAQEVFSIAQTPVAQGGAMPVDTGFLRNSLVAGLNGSTAMSGPDSYVVAIAGATLGDTIEGGWTASYARYVEYGTRGRAGRRFAGQAAAQWQQIVAAQSRALQERIG
jgi:hypothetical protein